MDFSPARLTLARRRRGLMKTRLAEEAGLTVRSLTNFESGKDAPSEATLARLASVLRFPIGFFREPGLEELPPKAASFRALKAMTAGQRDAALGAGEIAAQVVNKWLESKFKLPKHDLLDLDEYTPEAAAQCLRAQWGLGVQPVTNMVHLLESKGVRVFTLAEECSEVDAFCFWHANIPFILLNTLKSGERSRFDAAHELGHLVLHRRKERTGNEAEKEANEFASAFLMPEECLAAQCPSVVTVDALIQLKRGWGVSVGALAYRLRTINVLNDWAYRTIAMEIGKRGYRSHEPNGIPRETSQLLKKMFDSLATKGVRRVDVAREMNLPFAELEALTFGLRLSTYVGSDDEEPRANKPPRLELIQGELF